jgi:hypothetical protein
MDQFDYLSVLISIITGLGITHLLTGLGRFLGGPDSPRVYWVHVVWSVNVILMQAFFWWFTFKWADNPSWTFALFLFVLAYAILLYLLAVILYPVELLPGFDFRDHFVRRRKWFFFLLSFIALVDVFDTMLKGRENVNSIDAWGVLFLVFSLFSPIYAAFRSSTRFHQIYAAAWGIVLVSWILYSQGVLGG